MKFSVKGGTLANLRTECLITGIRSQGQLSESVRALDAASQGALSRIIKRGDLKAAPKQMLMLPDLPGVRATRVLLVGIETRKGTAADFRKLLQHLAVTLSSSPASDAVLCCDEFSDDPQTPARIAEEAVRQISWHTYTFDTLKGKKTRQQKKPPMLKSLALHTRTSARSVRQALASTLPIAQALDTTRTLGNLPGNICTPPFLAEEARNLAKKRSRLKVRVLGDAQLRKLGMHSFLSVAAGSRWPAQLIELKYQGSKTTDKPVVLVGKGITFDSGGISLKPGINMDQMKFDMCGAACVAGVMQAVADLGLNLNLVGLIGAAENMPGSMATRPGDIVQTMSGQTVEILNTDAEGRLVLCDLLTYAQRYTPQVVIDIATLTGAVLTALGTHASALYTADDALASGLIAAGDAVGDRTWRMPLWDEYGSEMKSNFADLANIGGRAGSNSAAWFLSRFSQRYTWAHLDIAGVAWHQGARKGATGRPVELLVQWLKNLPRK